MDPPSRRGLRPGTGPRIESLPLEQEQAQAAYRRLKSGEVKFRMVLAMG